MHDLKSYLSTEALHRNFGERRDERRDLLSTCPKEGKKKKKISVLAYFKAWLTREICPAPPLLHGLWTGGPVASRKSAGPTHVAEVPPNRGTAVASAGDHQ